MNRGRGERGVSFIELLAVVAMVSIIAMLAIPTARNVRRAQRERMLARSLSSIRLALDRYHHDWEIGCIEAASDDGWPESLGELTQEHEVAAKPECQPPTSTPTIPPPPVVDLETRNKTYLRKIPADPFNIDENVRDSSGWNARAHDDDFDALAWGGESIYDVYSGSEIEGSDGRPYSSW